MHGFYIEQRTVPEGSSLSKDLAQHIFMRGVRGSVVVATDRPHDLASVTKKQWYVLIRQVQRERASTLKIARITELSNQVKWMEHLRFTSKLEDDLTENSVTFADSDSFINQPPVCSTMYITQNISRERLYLITSWLRQGSVVVYYNPKN